MSRKSEHQEAMEFMAGLAVWIVIVLLVIAGACWIFKDPPDVEQARKDGHAEGFEEGRREGYKSCKDADKAHVPHPR